jgi:hypothetical protein
MRTSAPSPYLFRSRPTLCCSLPVPRSSGNLSRGQRYRSHPATIHCSINSMAKLPEFASRPSACASASHVLASLDYTPFHLSLLLPLVWHLYLNLSTFYLLRAQASKLERLWPRSQYCRCLHKEERRLRSLCASFMASCILSALCCYFVS